MHDDLREGGRISYVGVGQTGRVLGEHGTLLARDLRCGHVKWATDSSITLEDLADLAPLARSQSVGARMPRDDLADSLDVGPISSVGLRGVIETEGATGAVNALASAGQLGDLSGIVDDALNFVALRIRQEPLFRVAVSSLDDDEIDSLVALAARELMRDAAREVSDDD